MSDIRELLELAARAMGGEFVTHGDQSFSLRVPRVTMREISSHVFMRPDKSSGDCADMCAALGVSTKWKDEFVRCSANEIYDDSVEYYDEHHDRAAAWRMAALRVAAEIGKGME